MTSLLQRAVRPLDFSSREDRALMFDLACSDQGHLLNDVDNDIVLIINFYQQQAQEGTLHAFAVLVDGIPAGAVWLEVDRYGIGRVHCAMLPEFRTIWNGTFGIRWLLAFAFQGLGLRKVDSEFALYPKQDKQSAAYERILKRIGFQKRAVLPESLMVGGQPRNTLLLDFLKRDYNVKTKENQ